MEDHNTQDEQNGATEDATNIHPSEPEIRRAQIFQAVNLLKQMVGDGGLEEERLVNAQRLIDEGTSESFLPMIIELNNIIKDLIEYLKKNGVRDKEKSIEDFAANFIQIRANGTMFRYPLMTQIADNALHFLGFIDDLDQKALEVIEAHQNSISLVVAGKLQGDGGDKGKELQSALIAACQRYFKNKLKQKKDAENGNTE